MSAIAPVFPPVHGRVDPDGRLLEAESRLAELNARAGGTIGLAFAVPQIAVLARLAQRLGVTVARTVAVADGPDEIELWVRAEPDDDGVRLAISGWRSKAPWAPAESLRRDRDFLVRDVDWAWETDATLRLTAIGEALATTGVDANGLLGASITELFTIEADDDGAMPILGVLAMHEAFEQQPATVRASGQRVLLSGTPRRDNDGVFVGYVGTVRAVEGAASAAPAPAPGAEADTLGASFGAQLDRALRGPLGRIIANADSIHAQADGPIRKDYADYAADIAGAARHLMGLVDDLADLQAIERPDFQPLGEPIDVADVARRAAGLLNVRASERGVRIDRPQEVDSVPATGEFRRALQILVNLIGNAVRYSPDEGMVWIRTAREGDRAVVIVADQGRGIAVEDQARIFEKFERVDPSEPGGSGLGLYIARRLARAMGGDLTVDSAPGQGARFVLTIPARD